MNITKSLAPKVGIRPACNALDVSRAVMCSISFMRTVSSTERPEKSMRPSSMRRNIFVQYAPCTGSSKRKVS